jgi:hypothetical protein
VKKRVLLIGVALISLQLCGLAADASAQVANSAEEVPRVELWGAATFVTSGPTGVLTTSYSPPLLFDGDYTSHAGQTLNATTGFAVGVTAGVNVFATPRFGVQVLFDNATCDLAGTNGPYTIALQYVSRPPPDNKPQTVNIDQSLPWPDTSGALTQRALAFNAVVRLGRPDRVAVTMSGGPVYYRLSGAVQPLGFTTFHLGGHSVLFQDDYRLEMSLNPTNAVGFDAGGDVSISVARHAALMFGYRYFGGPTASVTVQPATVLNADQVLFEQTLDEIAKQLHVAPMQVSVSGSRVIVGLKVMLH